MTLGKKHIEEMKKIVASQESKYSRINKTLEALVNAGYIFIKESDNAYWGDKSITATPSLDGEDWLNEIDPDV